MKKQPAFPVEVSVDGNGNLKGFQTSQFSEYEMGLTKREYFAAKAMQGLISKQEIIYNPELIAEMSIEIADIILTKLA